MDAGEKYYVLLGLDTYEYLEEVLSFCASKTEQRLLFIKWFLPFTFFLFFFSKANNFMSNLFKYSL